jgi:2-C-methyl-D-erythritol 4-phosphate cytidylyltransferase
VLKAIDLSVSLQNTLVLVHDAVRPFVPADLIDQCLALAEEAGACIPVLKPTDTVKTVLDQKQIDTTLDRERLCLAQTPQVFRLDLLVKAFEKARACGYTGTDDASLLEHANIPVHVTPGSLFNIKLTTPEDLVLARCFMAQQ